MTLPPPVDWSALIADLKGAGLAPAAIGKELRVTHYLVYRWGQQQQAPNYTNGERLVLLWVRITRRPMEEVPRLH